MISETAQILLSILLCIALIAWVGPKIIWPSDIKKRTPGMTTYVIVVCRDVGLHYDERTIALVKFESQHAHLKDVAARDIIKNAVTAWVITSHEGSNAWAESSEDFNIGDLVNYTDDAALITELTLRGIHRLQVETPDCGGAPWEFDDVLLDREKLEEQET